MASVESMASSVRSRLVELPAEIRLKIFDYLFEGARAVVSCRSKCQVSIPQPINVSILRCCRALHDDAKVAFFANLNLHFQAEAIVALQSESSWEGEKSPRQRIIHIRPLIQKIVINIDSSRPPHDDLMYTFRAFARDLRHCECLRQCTIRDVQACSIHDVFKHNRVSSLEYERMPEQARIDYFKNGNDTVAAEVASGDKQPRYHEAWSGVLDFLRKEWLETSSKRITRNKSRQPVVHEDSPAIHQAAYGRDVEFYLESESRIIFWPCGAPVHTESQVSRIDTSNCELKDTRIVTEQEKRARVEERPFSIFWRLQYMGITPYYASDPFFDDGNVMYL